MPQNRAAGGRQAGSPAHQEAHKDGDGVDEEVEGVAQAVAVASLAPLHNHLCEWFCVSGRGREAGRVRLECGSGGMQVGMRGHDARACAGWRRALQLHTAAGAAALPPLVLPPAASQARCCPGTLACVSYTMYPLNTSSPPYSSACRNGGGRGGRGL